MQRVFIHKMKWLKYLGAVVCVLLIAGTLPSAYLIAHGLVDGEVDEPFYFAGKLVLYIAIVLVLAFISARLYKSARG